MSSILIVKWRDNDLFDLLVFFSGYLLPSKMESNVGRKEISLHKLHIQMAWTQVNCIKNASAYLWGKISFKQLWNEKGQGKNTLLSRYTRVTYKEVVLNIRIAWWQRVLWSHFVFDTCFLMRGFFFHVAFTAFWILMMNLTMSGYLES